jgi:amino acid adenylation domain-containing protein/non-ribosomal peptide synthase protein (TIGR01720 family)
VSSNDPAANIEAAYALSPMQEGMLFHTLLAPHSGIYLMQNRYRLEGALEVGAFVAAWRKVVQRHAMLRTRFVWKNQKRPLQVVLKRVDIPFDLDDLRSASEPAQEAHIEALLEAELTRGFDLGAPPTHFRLLRLGETRYEFVHSFHHIVLDEWCTSLLMTDFIALYEAERTRTPRELPPARPYRAYVDWLAKQDGAATEAFWRRYLGGFSTPTTLGLDERASVQRGQVIDLVERVDARTTQALSELVKRHRLTLNTVVQGAWALLLGRYAGTSEVVFGVTVAGRPPDLPEVDAIVGLFINTLPLRVRVDGEQALVPWLEALLLQNLTLREFEHTPLVDIQRFSAIERGRELFESLFVFENAPIDPALRATESFRVEAVQDRVHTNYPVTIMAWPDDQLGLKISFDSARVSPEAAQRMLSHLRTLLEGMALRPDTRLGELTLLTQAERTCALETWNPPAEPAPFASFASLLRAQVARTPSAIAARCNGVSLSYAELKRRANRVAHALLEHGVRVDDRVALVSERGLDLLTMIVAVLELGAAYVPIDPSYPSERIARIVGQSSARVVLTNEVLRPRMSDVLAPLAACPALLTYERVFSEPYAEREPADHATAQTLAYVIFTSGSTGTPKGAMVEQRGMLHNMLSKIPRLELGPGDVIAQTASACFDISVWQHLTGLLFGGTVEILADDVVREPARLLAEVVQKRVNVLEVVPSVLAGMLEALPETAERPSVLRWVLPTGEALPVPLARAWLRALPDIPLLNAYGPAECSDDVALHALSAAPDEHERTIPIGRPVESLRLYVLDPWLAPLPVGVAGELYVGGLGVGRGYLGAAALSASAFLPDPFAGSGARLYRTGDRARQRADGVLEFVGRTDHQVKLRGQRIELGEIESLLSEQASVVEAAVVVREDRPGAQRLVAYVVQRAGQRVAGEQLSAALARNLPVYMLPQAWVFLSSLPRSTNGKVERRALPAPELDTSEQVVAPRDEHEAALAAIWCEVLGLAEVGVTSSFFALGGHSLQLTQVLARVRRVFDVEVSLRSLFEAPTVAEQTRAILEQRAEPRGADVPVLSASLACAEPWPLSFAQERLWFLAQLEPSAAAYNIASAVELVGELDVERLASAWQALVQRHDALRTRVVEPEREGEGARARCDAVSLPLLETFADLRGLPEAERARQLQRVLERDATRPFVLTTGPLARTSLLRVDEDRYVLSIALHHLVTDGWSMGVLVRDLSELYAAKTETRPAQLPNLTVGYADYARWQRAFLAAGELDKQLAFWRERLGDGLPTVMLPTDQPRPATRSYRGARHNLRLATAQTEKLRALAAELGATPYTLLFAAFEVLIGRLSGLRSFAVGTPIANRGREELEPMIGFFANTLVLRADLRGEPSFLDLVARAREEIVGAQEHQDVPFERLVQTLRPTRDLSQTPLFQVMFSLQELTNEALPAAAGISLAPLELDPKSAQFDLSLHLTLDRDGLTGLFEYSTDLFLPHTIARWSNDFIASIEGLLHAPGQPIEALPVLRERAAEPAQKQPPVDVAGGERAPEVEDQLASIWASVLGRQGVGPDENFFALGGDSILSLDVVSRAKRAGLRMQARHMFQYQTLRELAVQVARQVREVDAESGPLQGETPLVPIQRRFFARGLQNPAHWNQTLLLQVEATLDTGALDRALRALVHHHDALRLRFPAAESSGRALFASDLDAAVLEVSDLTALAPSARPAAIEQHAERWQASLDLAHGPLLRAVFFRLGDREPARLLVVVHHLVIDGVSWRILLDDLEHAYDQAARGEAVELPDKTSSFRRWAEQLAKSADEPLFVGEAATWLELPWERTSPFAADDPSGDRSESSMASYDFALPEPETRALLELVPSAQRMGVDEVLLTALALALSRHTGAQTSAIEVEGHGREALDDSDLDLSRTIGWFTSAYPVVLTLPRDASERQALSAVKEQLRALPRHGLAYGMVRELGESPTAARLRMLPTPQVAFNYLGQWDGVLGEARRFALADESAGAEHDPRNELAYELEIEAAVHGHKLELSLRYSRARLRDDTVQRFGAQLLGALVELVAQRDAAGDAAYSPADFPDVALSASELDAILEQVD